jgi:hypothetical protein
VCFCKDVQQEDYCRRCLLSCHPLLACNHPLVQHHELTYAIKAPKDVKLYKFLRTIQTRRPTQEEIDDVFFHHKVVSWQQVQLVLLSVDIHEVMMDSHGSGSDHIYIP